jgi:hypothetical protein
VSLRRFFLLLITCCILLAPHIARADDAAAREHFKRGVDLYDKKQYEAALPEFRAAYAAKPSAGIKQNIGLTLKALGKRVEAATAFDEALEEGRGTLKPDTQAAIERELAELTKTLGTVTVKVVAGERTLDSVVISVDGAKLPPGAHRRPIRVEPGIHTFDAHVDGYGDPPQKKLALVGGSPVDATFEMRGGGNITIRPSLGDADVSIDGRKVAKGTYVASLPPGQHHIEVAAEGFLTSAADVQIAEGANMDLPFAMRRPSDPPDEYQAPDRKPPPPPKKIYIGAMLAATGEKTKIPMGTAGLREQTVGGLSIGLKGGYRFAKILAAELHLEIGGMEDKGATTTIDLSEWQATPVLRFATVGKVRFTAGMGFGLHGTKAKVTDNNLPERQGSTVTGSFLLDAGLQIDAGPIFLEPVLFFDVHGVASVRDDITHDRILEDSPATRYGLRLALAVPF